MSYNLLIGPKLIPTDAMIYKGAMHLFNMAGVPIHEYITINDHEWKAMCPAKEPTTITVLGTPWLWDQCWKSAKYANVLELFERYPRAARVFLGIGACFSKDSPVLSDYGALKNSLNADELKRLFDGAAYIACRDMTSTYALKDFNAKLRLCPAYWAPEGIIQHKTTASVPVMFWYDPSKGISQCDYNRYSDRFYQYAQNFVDFYEKTYMSVKTYCVEEKEIQSAIELGLPTPELITSADHALLVIANASKILSGRVHLAIPAVTLGTPVTLVGVDSREAAFVSGSIDEMGLQMMRLKLVRELKAAYFGADTC